MFENEFDNHEDSEADLWDDPQAGCRWAWEAGDFDLWSAGPVTGWRQCELPDTRLACGLRSSLRTKGVSWPFPMPRRRPCVAFCQERAGDGT
jgi:hypothetical protein